MAHRGSYPKRRKQWSAIPGIAFGMTADSTNGAGSLGFAEACTVLRMLGEYTIFPTSPPVAGDEVVVTIGIGVISSDAAALGATAFPDPSEEPEYPWLYWASHGFGYNGTLEESALLSSSLRQKFDVRSMRKIKPRESLQMVVQYADVGSAGDPPLTIVTGVTRVLIALA